MTTPGRLAVVPQPERFRQPLDGPSRASLVYSSVLALMFIELLKLFPHPKIS